jgi:dipeptidyl-peptidase-4
MFAKFSPDGTRVAYVHANNLYVQNLDDWLISRLTADGSSTIVNGTSDWVYEEEFELRDAYRWSPDGRAIAFWRFDTSGVGQFSLIDNTDTLYPVVTLIPYPKAGTVNSAVKIGVVDVTGSPTAGPARFLALPGDPRDTYVPRMEWVSGAAAGEIVLQQLDRLQNTNDVWLGDARPGP